MDASKDDWKASLKIISKKCHGYGFGWSMDAASVDASSDPPAWCCCLRDASFSELRPRSGCAPPRIGA